jgi:hypothetical protein
MNALPPPLFRRWVLDCAAGELLGIGIAGALAATYLLVGGEPQSVPERLGFLALMRAAGSLEGHLLGWFQARVLRELIPGLSVRRWVGLTVLIAFLGWLAGMLPSTLIVDTARAPAATGPDLDQSPGAFLALAAGAGLFVGALFGWLQWVELRRHVRRAGRWVLANAIGWAVALTWIYVAAPWPDAETPTGVVIASGLVGGTLAGLSLGLVTGLFLQRLLSSVPPPAA